MAAIDFDELFDRLGRIGHVGYVLAGNQAAVPALITDLVDEYENTVDDDLIGQILTQQPTIPGPVTTPAQTVASVAVPTLLRMVQASVPSTRSYQAALVELIRQMGVASESVAECTVGVSSAALSTTVGNAVLVTSTKRGDGLIQQNIVAEVGRLACSADSYTGGATAGQESWTYLGVQNTAGLWDYNFPLGSGANSASTAIAASEDANPSGNNLTNGDFEDWTDDATPELENWVMTIGAWGTDILRSSTAYQGTYSVRFNAGAANTILAQTTDDATGTNAALTSLTSYAFNFFARAGAGTVSAGVLTVELVDGSGTVINDQQGVANSFTLTLSTLTTSWVAVNGLFRVPEVTPAEMTVRFRISTDLAGDYILIDSAAMSPLTAAYPGGFGWVVFSGSTPSVVSDGWDVTATNNRAGVSYLGTFQSLFDRLFGMSGLGLLLPYSGTPTQADTKITA